MGAQLQDITRSADLGHPAATHPDSDFIEASLKDEADHRQLQRNTGIWIKFEGNSDDRIPNNLIYLERKRNLYEHLDRTFFRRKTSGIKDGQFVFMAVVSNDQHGNGSR